MCAQEGGEGAQEGDEGEGADAGEEVALAFALEADEEAEAQGEREGDEEGGSVHVLLDGTELATKGKKGHQRCLP